MKATAEHPLVLKTRLAELCERAFASMGFPLATISEVRVRELCTERFGSEGPQRCYVLTVVSSNPAMLRGNALPYKGSYKERTEAIIQDYLNHVAIGATAHIEIGGPQDGSLDGLLSLEALAESGKAAALSPLVQAARRYLIPYAILHGRHLVGPSPAFAAVVRRIVTSDQVNTILDLFAGTGIAAKVACTESKPRCVTVVEVDPTKVEALGDHLRSECVTLRQESAFSYPINQSYDLVVADPFYEQIMDFLDAQGGDISNFAGCFLLASGSIEDFQWNKCVRARLLKLGFRVLRHSMFGQVIFECRRISAQ